MKPFELNTRRVSILGLVTMLVLLAHGAFAQAARVQDRGTAARDPASRHMLLVQATPEAETETVPPADSQGELASMTVEIAPKPVVLTRGKAEWSDGFGVIMAAIARLDAAIKAAGLVRGGRPLAVYRETDEEGFQFEAMIPLAEPPKAGAGLPTGIEIGTSPQGKAIKFQHRGPYDDIESTYNLITTFLDEKGVEAQDLFIEEYLTETKEPDDIKLEVDIYVFLK